MKLNLAIILSVIVTVGLVAMGFTFFQISREKSSLVSELKERSARTAEEILANNLDKLSNIDLTTMRAFADSINKRYSLAGIAVYFSKDNIVTDKSSSRFLGQSLNLINSSAPSDSLVGNFIHNGGRKFYQYIRTVRYNSTLTYSAIFYTDAAYIDNHMGNIWFRNFLRWFIQALLVSMVTIFVIRWGIFSPINKIVDWVKAVRMGNIDWFKQEPPPEFLSPLHTEIVHIAKAMHEARENAEEEARLRSSSQAIWTPERLKVEVENILQNRKMIVVSNREPYMHIHDGKGIKCIVPASGMITAMEPILKACGGMWIASGTGDADKETVDKNDTIGVPPGDPRYTLKRLWLTEEEENHFYYGFSNEGLWPLCHVVHTRPVFRGDDWKFYQKVNQDFADAVIGETIDDEAPFILIQDYHFALLPELIKKKKPLAKVAIFWHIPWPNPESFGICPWQREILRGMLGADLIGFHTQYHCNHFLETVNKSLESRVAWENFSIKMAGQVTFVKPFPISIEFTLKDFKNSTLKLKPAQLIKEFGLKAEFIGIGVDRVDYTKGIPEKFLSIERFLEKNPLYIGKLTFIQIGAPSRTRIKSYSDIMTTVENEAARINLRFKSKTWRPILLLNRHHSHAEIIPFYSSADFCMVTSLHDGMNLVAKEFVASRHSDDGVLILSPFTGASQELREAIIVNPYDIEKSADAIKKALEMSKEEQSKRMKEMRQVVLGNNIYSWAATLLQTMVAIHD